MYARATTIKKRSVSDTSLLYIYYCDPASHRHFVKKEETRGAGFLEKRRFCIKRGEKEAYSFRPKKN
jgi:hypothetical protein